MAGCTKKAGSDDNCCLRSEFRRLVSLLLVVAASDRFNISNNICHWAIDLAVVPQMMGRSRPRMWYGHGRTGRIGSYAYDVHIYIATGNMVVGRKGCTCTLSPVALGQMLYSSLGLTHHRLKAVYPSFPSFPSPTPFNSACATLWAVCNKVFPFSGPSVTHC